MPKYDLTFWRRVAAHAERGVLMGTLQRLVENQLQKVTLPLTDNLTEHELLESLLESSKPRPNAAKNLRRFDYLLRSPWRYPPLPWGSRFGTRQEPSLFYGALSRSGLLAEAAYYRLLFLEGMTVPFPERVVSQLTVFEAIFRTASGLDLTRAPFARHERVLRHPADYRPCQALGAVLREKGVEAVTYLSARTRDRAVNVALFEPAALRSRRHLRPQHGLSELTADGVTFRFGEALDYFPREQFLYRGRLPSPA